MNMNSERIYTAIGAVDEELIERCTVKKKRLLKPPGKYIGLAACLCLIAAGAYGIFHPAVSEPSGNPVLQWSEQFSAKDYFKYNSDDGISSSNSIADSAIPYAHTRSFSDEREKLAADGVIPAMSDYPLFDCTANYNEDGSIYSLIFSWHKRGSEYSDLSITAGYQEVELIEDCIFVELDEYGNIKEPAVTVTDRDGIQIIAEGGDNRKKTITFQNDSGWYQIEGSWNDRYEDMAMLLDFIWEHPVDFERFDIESGILFSNVTLSEKPNAFYEYIPDFAEFGFIEEFNSLTLKNGEPYKFEANYVAHADPELVKESSYYSAEGWTNIHWCITTEPSVYDLQDSLGDLEELNEQLIADKLKNSSNFAFVWDEYFIRIYTNTPQEVWRILALTF